MLGIPSPGAIRANVSTNKEVQRVPQCADAESADRTTECEDVEGRCTGLEARTDTKYR